jgi:Raf kinase inhibitor-like YbhB/YbcL family protein
MAMTISSNAFREGEAIPRHFTCDGEDVSPPLSWIEVPKEARSLALICDDPDAPAGTWVHWVLWNLPPSTPTLPEGVPKEARLPGGIQQGKNSWPRTGYNGPCPPPGKPHRYFFKLYALDTELSLPDGGGKSAVENAMKGHILAQAQLIGTYGRK